MKRLRRTFFAAQLLGTAAFLLLDWMVDNAARREQASLKHAFRADIRAFRAGWAWLAEQSARLVRWIGARPQRSADWIVSRPWDAWLTVRKGFIFGAVIGFVIAESSLQAITTLSYWARPMQVSVMLPPRDIGFPVRSEIPANLAWFFIEYPFLSQTAKIQAKNRHTFTIEDSPRQKIYVVTVGQHLRRVEMYANNDRNTAVVQIYTPGSKRSVTLVKGRVVAQSTASDGNLWMWRSPLWSPLHLKIYGMADRWLDSPFKRYSCAGFVHKFLGDAGIQFPILDAWDIAKQPWMRVPVDEMEPGDIITIRALTREHRRMWHHTITHVGVYIGYGKMIHASTSAKSKRAWVRIADVNEFRGRIDKVLRAPGLQ